MNDRNSVIWLQERTALGILSEGVLSAIATKLQFKTLQVNEILVIENTLPDGLYILQTGRLEILSIASTNTIGTPDTRNLCSLLPGSVINLQELLLDQPVQATVKILTDSEFWFIGVEEFRQLVTEYPEISQSFTKQLTLEIAQLSAQLTYEQERQTILRPYLVTKAIRGIVGKSRYAVRLRQQIRSASADKKSVVIFGEPGLEKDNIAALIHFSSSERRQPIIKVNCRLIAANGLELFGRMGGKPGLIESLGEGTLVLNNIQELPTDLMPDIVKLLQTNTYTPLNRAEEISADPRTCVAKILIISEKSLPEIDKLVTHLIKVPPLRVRKADISEQAEYYIRISCRAKSLAKPRITPEALRRLQAYDFPNNIRELQSLTERAIAQSNCASELTEEVFWATETKKKRFRLNLLNAYPNLRQFLRSPWWPDRINYGFTLAFFAIVVAILCLGPQNRAENFALNMFWAWWWPLILISFPFVGRLWCSVCPFMIYGEVTQKISLKLWPRQLKRWPRQEAEKWGGWFLFGLFVLIFLWEELWNLENTAYLSACLLLLITAGAMIFSAIFERRFWCRYLCPIGGMNGLFAKLSMTELRAQQGTCSAECTTYQCYKGGPQKGEGLETNGCPLYSHPAQLEDNRDCVLCMTCLKACPHRSVELNLRPPGIELWTTHVPRSSEVALLLLLLGGIFLHRLPELQAWLGLEFNLSQFYPHLGLSVAALIVPAAIPIIAWGVMQLFYRIRNYLKNRTENSRANLDFILPPLSFQKLAYGYLPLVLGGNLAHYLQLGLGEAGRILPVTFATFGLNGGGLPILIADPAVIAFLQGTTLTVSVLLTIILTQKIAKQPGRSLLLQHLSAILLTLSLWEIIVGR
jgi:transcriptional regulator with AAA-type ATPase domain/NAD-dependent dihydropyrimidine dehydrogenase PreA subunit